MRARPRVPALLLAAALVLAACGDQPTDEAPSATDEEVEAPEDGTDDGADAAVGIAETELGEILVDADGRTLYVFDSDEQGASTCYDECADNWPPLVAERPVAAEGADDGLVGTTTRDDERDQVTYDDWPLYYWTGDSERGDVSGQGVEGVWWTIDASGQPQRDTAEDEGDVEESPSY